MRAHWLLLSIALGACANHEAPVAIVVDSGAMPVAPTPSSSAEIRDGSAPDAGATIFDAGTTAKPKPHARIPEPQNCGLNPKQPGCNCFTNHPHSTCFDP